MARILFPYGYLAIIRKYLMERNRRCFTYRGLRVWLYRHQEYRDVEWHTMERSIRELARLGYLERIEVGKHRVIFCWSSKADEALERFERLHGYSLVSTAVVKEERK